MKLFRSILATVFCAGLLSSAAIGAPKSEVLFIASKAGVGSYRMDLQTGTLTNLSVASGALNPQFLAIHPSHRFLFVLNGAMIGGKKTGVVSSFSIEPKTGVPTLINQQPSPGGSTHLDVDHAGKNVLVANYGGGSVSVFPIGKDGALAASSAFIQHKGSSVNPQRQAGPHAHVITTDPADHFAFTCDLGLDQVLVYKLDSAKGALTPNDPAFASLKPGSGPRHMAFHPSGKFVYVINELDSTMTAFSYDPKRGVLTQVQNVSTLPKDFVGKNFPAEVAVHPNGKFVYGSNRGHDSIVVFSVDQKTGQLTLLDHASTKGKTPRHFEIDPTGQYLLAENQDSGNVVVFRIDSKTGGLTATGTTIEVEAPQCVKFLPANF
ncbi:MAG: pgl [Verrucomicrobiales bacterium]|nr:pgl [Verrucomicrobiales bacterium]